MQSENFVKICARRNLFKFDNFKIYQGSVVGLVTNGGLGFATTVTLMCPCSHLRWTRPEKQKQKFVESTFHPFESLVTGESLCSKVKLAVALRANTKLIPSYQRSWILPKAFNLSQWYIFLEYLNTFYLVKQKKIPPKVEEQIQSLDVEYVFSQTLRNCQILGGWWR